MGPCGPGSPAGPGAPGGPALPCSLKNIKFEKLNFFSLPFGSLWSRISRKTTVSVTRSWLFSIFSFLSSWSTFSILSCWSSVAHVSRSTREAISSGTTGKASWSTHTSKTRFSGSTWWANRSSWALEAALSRLVVDIFSILTGNTIFTRDARKSIKTD